MDWTRGEGIGPIHVGSELHRGGKGYVPGGQHSKQGESHQAPVTSTYTDKKKSPKKIFFIRHSVAQLAARLGVARWSVAEQGVVTCNDCKSDHQDQNLVAPHGSEVHIISPKMTCWLSFVLHLR